MPADTDELEVLVAGIDRLAVIGAGARNTVLDLAFQPKIAKL